ncbi:hypothetical protein HJA89_28925 [Rhizobium bangladeshense]|nr:hypothetical protein [Rhizobium bangladeshense]
MRGSMDERQCQAQAAYTPNRGHRVPDPLKAAIGKRPPVNQEESDTALALGAQAGERRLAEVIRSCGFTHARRATQTPLNMVLEATG